jgi:hypothetical protein
LERPLQIYTLHAFKSIISIYLILPIKKHIQPMTTDPAANNIASEESSPNFYTRFMDKFIPLMSIWVALVLCIYFKGYLPNLNWPWYLDQILIFIFVLILVVSTLEMLKPIIALAIIVGIIILCVSLVQNNGETESSKANNHAPEVNIFNYFKSISEIDNVVKQNADLKLQLDSVQNQLDSISKQLKTIVIDNSQSDKLKNVD